MIDYAALETALDNLKPGQKLYKLLKTVLSRQGRWKNKAHGKPFDKGFDSRRHKL